MTGKPEYVHAANSAASLRFTDSEWNAVRMGISMYGLESFHGDEADIAIIKTELYALRTEMVAVKAAC